MSATIPVTKLNAPMKTVYDIYLPAVDFALNVKAAFAKKLNVTATTKPAKFDTACDRLNR